MSTLASWVVRHRGAVLASWVVLIGFSGLLALRLPTVLTGGSDGVPGSPSVDAIERAVAAGIPAGTFFPFLVVVTSDRVDVQDERFEAAVHAIEDRLMTVPGGGVVRSYWNTGRVDLLGRGRRSALLLFRADVANLNEAEVLTPKVRGAVVRAGLPQGFGAYVTGTPPMYFDLNRQSSTDLILAERVGVPLTLGILLVAFGSPVAAGLPVLLALSAVAISATGLYLLSSVMPVSVFSQNAVSMIGLGVGVDYALFIVESFRIGLSQDRGARESAVRCIEDTGHTVIVSGLAVATGFCALLLVHLPFLVSMALGGVAVVATAVVASLTLLPVVLSYVGLGVNWPRGHVRRPSEGAGTWGRWATVVMRRPWTCLVTGMTILAIFVVPVGRLRSWNVGVEHLVPAQEARRGYDVLSRDFEQGAIGPTILLVEAPAGRTMWDSQMQQGMTSLANRLSEDPRVARVNGFPDLLSVASSLGRPVQSAVDLPERIRPLVRDVLGADDRTALVVLLPTSTPESRESMLLVDDLRRDAWPELAGTGTRVSVSGATALTRDFDDEVFGRMRVVVPAVLLTTFLVLLVSFRSILIPFKAVLLNLLSVLASYGFLVYVFQDGRGAGWIGLTAPGGLNSLIVLVLFTVLFGLSMDYGVFLLGRIRDAYATTGDNRRAVARGVQGTAGSITSAALVMVSIFTACGFTRLVVTRELGLGLAFAVALDATLVRLVLVPAAMALLGRFNWWFPGWHARHEAILPS